MLEENSLEMNSYKELAVTYISKQCLECQLIQQSFSDGFRKRYWPKEIYLKIQKNNGVNLIVMDEDISKGLGGLLGVVSP